MKWHLRELEPLKTDLMKKIVNPENQSFENASVVTFQ